MPTLAIFSESSCACGTTITRHPTFTWNSKGLKRWSTLRLGKSVLESFAIRSTFSAFS
jgi:hypothetical protein